MKNLKKIALMTLLGVGTFIPATKAKSSSNQKNINIIIINTMIAYKTYVCKLDSVKNLKQLKEWVKTFKKEILNSLKNIQNTHDIQLMKNGMNTLEKAILSINELSDYECKNLTQNLKCELLSVFSEINKN